MIKNKRVVWSFFFGILFFLVFLWVVFDKCSHFDTVIYDVVMIFRNPFFDFYFTSITRFADTFFILFVVFLFILVTRNKYALFLAVGTVDSFLLTTVLKHLVGRSRPVGLKLIEQGGYSFPSGHTMFAVIVYGYLLYFAITKIQNKILRYSVSSLLLLVILSIGVSRIYVGVHFASDVLAGYLLGICYLLLLIDVLEKFDWKRG